MSPWVASVSRSGDTAPLPVYRIKRSNWDMEHSFVWVVGKNNRFVLSQLCYVLDVIRKSAIIETTNVTPDHTPSH